MKHPTNKISKLALGAALAGLLAGTASLTSCTDQGKVGASERNGCNGPNGCGAAGKKVGEKNTCSGPNGCNGHGDKKAEKNTCSGPNGCNGHGTKK